MAGFVSTNAYLQINAVDLSAYAKNVKLDYAAEMKDDTAHGATTRSNKGGLKVWSIEAELFQDHAGGAVDATLFSLVGTTFTVATKPVNAATAPTNPQFSGTGILESYPPVNGPHGEMSMVSITIRSASALSRAEA